MPVWERMAFGPPDAGKQLFSKKIGEFAAP